MIRYVWAFLLLAMTTGPALAEKPQTMLCEQQGLASTVEALPSPADQWMKVVCTPTGQALMPRIENGYIWVAHGTTRPILINALPEGAKMLSLPDMQPSELLRFVKFSGAEMTGDRADRAMKMLEKALEGEPLPPIESVYQLDAQSTYEGTIINMFVYRIGEQPELIIACQSRCRKSATIDVITLDGLTENRQNQ